MPPVPAGRPRCRHGESIAVMSGVLLPNTVNRDESLKKWSLHAELSGGALADLRYLPPQPSCPIPSRPPHRSPPAASHLAGHSRRASLRIARGGEG